MKVIDLAIQTPKKQDSKLVQLARRYIPFLRDTQDNVARTAVIKIFERLLDNQFVVLLNVSHLGLEVPIPMILIGPPGVWVLYTSSLKGVFRATEDTWEMLDDRSHRYRLVKPNLLQRTFKMARAVEATLVADDLKIQQVEAALFLTDPGVHIDSTRPVVKVVRLDALERFALNLLQLRPILDKEGVYRILHALAGEGHPALEPKFMEDVRDAFSFRDVQVEKAGPLAPNVIYDRSESPYLKKVPFNKKQLIVLGLMVLVNILVLGALVLFVVLNT